MSLSCETCVSAAFTSGGIYCRTFLEDIKNPAVANDCEAYEEDPVQATPKLARPALSVVLESPTEEPPNVRSAFPDLTQLVEDELREICEQYLATSHAVLWGQAIDINTSAGLRRAAEWLANQICGVMDFAMEGVP